MYKPVSEESTAISPTPDKDTQLEKLHEMKEKGILSEEEFASEKARLLT